MTPVLPAFSPDPVHDAQGPLVSEAARRTWAGAEAPLRPEADPDERLVHAVRTAVLAPSVFNTQPWAFRARGGGAIDLLADRSRQLPALDPDGRLLMVSCGAALLLLRVGAARLGLRLHVRPLPDFGRPDLLATAEIAAGPPEPGLVALAPAVAQRRTHRGPFDDRPVPESATAAMAAEAEAEGVGMRQAPEGLPALVVRATEALGADEGVRSDFAAWLRPLREPAGGPVLDGVPDYAQDEWGPRSYTTGGTDVPLPWPDGRTENDRQKAASAPAALVFATAGDNPFEWFAAGQAHARAVLRATLLGLASSYLLGPVVVPAVRAELAEALGGRCPQVLLRVGYATPGAPTPRRPLSAVLR